MANKKQHLDAIDEIDAEFDEIDAEFDEVEAVQSPALAIVDEEYEVDEDNEVQELRTHPVDQIIYGLSLFRESRAEILSGSTTYFIIIASMPMLLSLSYMYAGILGAPELALEHVLSLVKTGLPNLDKALFENISTVINAQLLKEDTNYLNLFFLVLSGLGFAQSTYFGLMYISDYRKDNPLQEGLYSGLIGLATGCYFTVISFLLTDITIMHQLFPTNSFVIPALNIISKYSVISVALSLIHISEPTRPY